MAEVIQDDAAAAPPRSRRPGVRARLAEEGVVLSRSALVGRPFHDSSPGLLARGYAWLPDRRGERPATRVRLLGQRAVGLAGPEAVSFFYDEAHVRRHTALPGAVQSTLFGHGAVHTLDGSGHRHRKAMFMSLMTVDASSALVERAERCWDRAVPGWAGRDVALFDESSRVITRAVCDWAGVPVAPDDVSPLAADLVALVDGFGNGVGRQLRARRARARREAWLAGIVARARGGARVEPGSALDVVAHHRDEDGRLLDERTAAVELINVIRPTVAVSWFVAYAGHALHLWPANRDRLRSGDPAFTAAFVHELRRFYPFAPFVGGRAVRDLEFRGVDIPADALVLLDLYGQNHDAAVWGDPYVFRPERFLARPPGSTDLVPQGGGDPHTGHRCPGEGITIGLLETLVTRLAGLDWVLPPQDLTISLRRVPARPRSGVVLRVRPAPEAAPDAAPG